MKSVFILFDSLVLNALQSYGGTEIETPNFNRLAEKGVQFNNHYVGSLPCMPARRDLHTGRLNFMHRAWGPLEPFDNSWVKILRERGTHCHLITDHYHYFENGGMGYHTAFNSWDFIRGQEYDGWKVMLSPPHDKFKKQYDARHYPIEDTEQEETDVGTFTDRLDGRMQHMVNNEFMADESDLCTPKCFQSALEFLDVNSREDNWMLWLECFDPHEPFHTAQRFEEKSGLSGQKRLNWPNYMKFDECDENSDGDIAQIRNHYAASLRMCDEYLGKMLDYFDEHNLWEDTALILTTDHGFLLGEHEWWGKSRQPYYQEIAHIPLYVYHPDYKDQGGTKRHSLTQTPDLMPTMLDIFNAPIPKEVQGKSVMPIIKDDVKNHDAVIFGMFAGPIGITDGQYVYFHFPDFTDKDEFYDPNLCEYTVVPMHMKKGFTVNELSTMEVHQGFNFTKGSPVLKVRTYKGGSGRYFSDDLKYTVGSGLFDIKKDPSQQNPITDGTEQIERLKKQICTILDNHDSPKDFYKAYALV